MIPSSFCTIATNNCKQELAGFLFSLAIHHPYAHVYIMCDTQTKKYIQTGYIPNLTIIWNVSLDSYSKYNRAEMEKMGIWSDFQMSKANIIEKVLQFEPDTLFLDSDIIILDKIEININIPIQLGVSPGFINKKTSDIYGYYNGGMLWTNQISLPEAWRQYTKTSRYYDQASIEDLCKKYSFFTFNDNYNLQTWRFIYGEESSDIIMSYITIKKNKVMYKNKPLKFIHTHFNTKINRFTKINNYFINLLHSANCYKELLCIYYVIHSKWKFYIVNISSPWNDLIILMSKKSDIEYTVSYTNTNVSPILFSDKLHIMDKIMVDIEIPQKPVLQENAICWLPLEERTIELFNPIKHTFADIRKSKFGIGNMAELMAFGTIPILKRNFNVGHDCYILDKDVLNMNKEKWTEMSKKCQLWYIENRHSSSIWYTILNHIFL